MIENNSFTDFLEFWMPCEVAKYPDFIFDRIGADLVKERVLSEVKTLYKFAYDDEFVASKIDFSKFPDFDKKDFNYRILSCAYGKVITSIRFIGGDLSAPCVFIMANSFSINSIDIVRDLCAQLKVEYDVFKPKRIRFYQNGNKDLFKNVEGVKEDMCNVAQFIDVMKQQTELSASNNVRLKKATNVSWYDRYRDAYLLQLQKYPEFKEMLYLESKDSLGNFVKSGTAFEIFCDSEWAGIIVVSRASELLMSGYLVYEEFVLEEYRGKGIASHAQRQLIGQVKLEKDDMLFGTIHYNNKASIKTALKAGRLIIGKYLMVDIS